MKTKEELNALKEEIGTLNKKLAELTEDELQLVVGGGQECDEFLAKIRPAMERLSPEQDKALLQTYRKEIGSDKNAKIIYS